MFNSQVILYYLSCLFTLIITMCCYSKMSKSKIKINLKIVITTIISSMILYINNLYNIVSLRFICIIIILAMSNKICFGSKFKTSLFYSFIYILLITILEMIFSPLITINIKTIEAFNNNVALKIVFSMSISLISMCIIFNNNFLSFINRSIKLVQKDNNMYKIIIFILIFCEFLVIIRAIEVNNINLIIITLISSLFIIFSIKTIIIDKYNLNIIIERNNNLKESYIAYSKTIEDCKEFKHNLKNELYSVKSLLPKEGQEQLNTIIQKYYVNYDWINKIDEIPEGLQGLIYLKQKEAQQKKINIIINTNKTIKTKTEDYIDLCSVIGILLDNAIESSINANSKVIELIIKNESKNLNIKIINIHKNKIDLLKIGNKNYSTKEYRSGLGLNYIKKLNNKKIKVNFKITNNLFITNILYK